MSNLEARTYWEDWGLVLLWTAFLLPPAAWFFDQGLSYALVKWVCASGHTNVLTAITAAALAMTVGGGLLAMSLIRQLRREPVTDDGGRMVDRSLFVALVAVAFNLLAGLLIVTAGVARFVLSPCE